MTTSLAQQLGALRKEQKDALQVPDRAKVSFLFDAKQASNIDDQTLWYICASGIRQLKEAQVIDLSVFESDLLAESSLRFFRGGMTKDQLDEVDTQVDTLIRALSPCLLESAALKIVEYLIRIYEAHVYHKETLLMAFMPLFESVYFLRIAQCLNLAKDQVWGWLHDFAYKGVSIDKPLLVKCISRNNGLIFGKCAQFCFEVGGHLHTKWFGAFLSEVLKTNKNEGLLFTVLPFISKALKQQDSRDMRVSCFLALGQLASRRSLTAEYTQAFVHQLLQSLQAADKLEFDQDLKLKGLQTLLFFTEYQKVNLDAKCFKYLKKVPKLSKLLASLQKLSDTSSLSKAIIDSDVEIILKKSLLEPLVNLKAVFMAVQSAIIDSTQNPARTTELLKMLKELSPDYFRQSVVYILKSVHEQSQREAIIKLLDSEGLHKTFGDGGNYSMLSALGSPQKHTRDAALTAICSRQQFASVDPREKSLIHLVLIQLLDQGGLDQESMGKLLSALAVFTEQATDVDYESLLRAHDNICEGKVVYQRETSEQILRLLSQIKVTRPVNITSQNWLHTQQSKDLPQQLDTEHILSLFQNPHATYNYALIAKALRKLTGQPELFSQILSCLKRKPFQNVSDLLNAIADGSDNSVKLVSKLVGVSLIQKQWGQPVDLRALHKKLSGDLKAFAETMVRMAISSKSKLKQLFACQTLTSFHTKGKLPFQVQVQLSPKIMIGVVLMLLNDSDKHVREQAITLAEAVLTLQQKVGGEKHDFVDIFCDTEKPQSTQKKAVKLTPMKSKSVSSLLQELIDAQNDLVLDRGQLKPVLSKHQKPEVYEEILRTLLDYPTWDLKRRLLAVLTLPQQHVMIFCMNLTQVLPKVFTQVGKASDLKIDEYLASLGDLISHLQEYSASAAKIEIQKSLTIPFLKAVQDRKSMANQVLKMYESNILVEELKQAEQRTLKEVFKIYLRAADPKLRQLFSVNAGAFYKGDDLAYCLRDVKELELALETTIELASPSTKLFEQALIILDSQIQNQDFAETSYVIQLSAQLAQLSLPQKVKSLKDQISLVVNMTRNVWQKTKQMVDKGLRQEIEQVEDPFNEYMKSDHHSNQSDDEDEEVVDLLPCLQVTISLTSLLTDLEQREITNKIPHTTQLLAELADHLIETSSKKSAAKSAIKSQLFHMYQSLVIRTTRNTSHFSELIVKFTQTSVKLIDQGAMSYLLLEQGLTLNVLRSVSPQYTALVYYTLLGSAVQSQVKVDANGLISSDDSASLTLLRELMWWQLDSEQQLGGFEELMYLVHHVEIFDGDFVATQTEVLFADYESDHLKHAKNLLSGKNYNMVFLSCALFTQWFSKEQKFLTTLGQIAGTEIPSPEVQSQLLNVLLSSYIIREQVTQRISQESTPKLTQLQHVVTRWQSHLNSMMSLQIHIQLVLKILDMKSLQLKVNTLVLLLEKLSSFQGNWLNRCQVSLHKVVCSLVCKCLEILQSQQNEQLAQLLLTVVAHTASLTLPKDLQTKTLEVTATQHRGGLQLQSQAILTETTLMEVYSLTALDHFHVFLKHTLDGFNQAPGQMFIDSYKQALLKALVCITQVFLKFLTADQLESLITFSLVTASELVQKPGDLVEMILENVALNAVTNKKLVLQATMNSYAVVAQSTQNDGFPKIAERYFTQLLAPVIRRLPQSFISEHYQKFVTFFKQMFGLPVQRPESTEWLVLSFNAFVLKLNEETLRPIVSSLSKWSTKHSKRQIVFFEILCGCLETLHEFFVPMVRIYFDSLVNAMVECHQTLGPTKPQKRPHVATGDASFELLTITCRLTELTYKYDTGAFLQNDSFEQLTEPIADLFDLARSQPDSLVQSLRRMIFEMDERTTDDSMWQRLNYAMLLKTRSSSWQVRLAVLTVIDFLFEKMRERFLVVLNDTIPFMSELLEDEDEKVEMAAKSIVQRIEQMTGESINDYLK